MARSKNLKIIDLEFRMGAKILIPRFEIFLDRGLIEDLMPIFLSLPVFKTNFGEKIKNFLKNLKIKEIWALGLLGQSVKFEGIFWHSDQVVL